AAITGGVAGYTYAWTGPNSFTSTTASINGMIAGQYCVAVTDTNGCAAQACITLNEPTALSAQANATSASCGGNNGNVDASIGGGTVPYIFLWDNSAQTEDLSNVPAGTFTL